MGKAPVLSNSSTRAIAEKSGSMTDAKMMAEFIKARLVNDEADYLEKASEISPNAEFEGKIDRLDHILRYFATDPRILGVAGALLSRSYMGLAEIDELNSYLARDGLHFDWKKKRLLPTTGNLQVESGLATELDDLLRCLDSRFPVMRQGIWDALSSTNKDKARHAISSSRELLAQVIDELAGKPPGNPTRKERIGKILESRSESELIDAVSNLVDKIYALSSSGTHTKPSNEEAVLCAKMTEYCLLFVLTRSGGAQTRASS